MHVFFREDLNTLTRSFLDNFLCSMSKIFCVPDGLSNNIKVILKPLSDSSKTFLRICIDSKFDAIRKLSWNALQSSQPLHDLLNPDIYVGSDIICTYFELLEHNCHVVCLSLFAYRGSLITQTKTKVSHLLKAGKGHILIPVNQGGTHWYLVVIDVAEHTLGLYNSLTHEITNTDPTIQQIQQLLAECGSVSSWHIVRQKTSHQTAVECGIYTCINARLFLAGCVSFVVRKEQADDFALQMRYKILNDILNPNWFTQTKTPRYLWYLLCIESMFYRIARRHRTNDNPLMLLHPSSLIVWRQCFNIVLIETPAVEEKKQPIQNVEEGKFCHLFLMLCVFFRKMRAYWSKPRW